MARLRLACSRVLPLALSIGLAGCDDGGGGGSSGGSLSCTYRGAADAGTSVLDDSSCAVYGGSVVPTSCFAPFVQVPSCPAENRIGECVVVQETSAGSSVTTLYFYPPNTLESAMSGCSGAMGTFTAL